ncbi:hypothetical protein WDW89_02160 [Deltaproteobacteria bacterium TL4]
MYRIFVVGWVLLILVPWTHVSFAEDGEYEKVVAEAPKEAKQALVYFRKKGDEAKLDKYYIKAYLLSKEPRDLEMARALKKEDLAEYERLRLQYTKSAAPSFLASVQAVQTHKIQQTSYDRVRIPLVFQVTIDSDEALTKSFDVQVEVKADVLFSWESELLGKKHNGTQVETYSLVTTIRINPDGAKEQLVDIGSFYQNATQRFAGGTRSFTKAMQGVKVDILGIKPAI